MTKRQVEVFISGCSLCDETVKLVQDVACDQCDVRIYDLRLELITNDRDKAAKYGIHRVPSIVVDGKLVECCENQTPITREALVAAGIGHR